MGSNQKRTEKIISQVVHEIQAIREAMGGLGDWLSNLAPYVQEHEKWIPSLQGMGNKINTLENIVQRIQHHGILPGISEKITFLHDEYQKITNQCTGYEQQIGQLQSTIVGLHDKVDRTIKAWQNTDQIAAEKIQNLTQQISHLQREKNDEILKLREQVQTLGHACEQYMRADPPTQVKGGG